jgi:hypothetical protein
MLIPVHETAMVFSELSTEIEIPMDFFFAGFALDGKDTIPAKCESVMLDSFVAGVSRKASGSSSLSPRQT